MAIATLYGPNDVSDLALPVDLPLLKMDNATVLSRRLLSGATVLATGARTLDVKLSGGGLTVDDAGVPTGGTVSSVSVEDTS